MLNTKLSIRSVRVSIDTKFLFDLLKERDSYANISHKKMPTFASHVKFLESKPYKKWYIISIKENINEDKKKIYFTHLNHTNRALVEDSVEYNKIITSGYNILEDKTIFKL